MSASLTALQSMLTVAASGYTQYISLAAVENVPCVVIEPLAKFTYSRNNYLEEVSYMVTVIAKYNDALDFANNISAHADRISGIAGNLMNLPVTSGYLASIYCVCDQQIEYDKRPGDDGDTVLLGYFSVNAGLS